MNHPDGGGGPAGKSAPACAGADPAIFHHPGSAPYAIATYCRVCDPVEKAKCATIWRVTKRQYPEAEGVFAGVAHFPSRANLHRRGRAGDAHDTGTPAGTVDMTSTTPQGAAA